MNFIKDIVGNLGVLPRLAVDAYEKEKDKRREAEDELAKFMGQQESSTGMKKGGKVKVSSASKRADGIAQRGKTRGRMV